jgi:S1-C subfamily serine protease
MCSLSCPVRPGSWLAAAAVLAAALGGISVPVSEAAEASPAATVRAAPEVRSSVVKVTSTVRLPEPLRPWAKGPPRPYHATGVVIAGDRILTTARVVEFAENIEVQAEDSGDQIPATVECVAPSIGLAVLKLSDPTFL